MGNILGGGVAILDQAPVSKDPDCYCPYDGPGPWFSCKPEEEQKPRLAKKGIASREGCPPETFAALLKKAAELKGDKPAMKAWSEV
eukprot:s4951_g4.t1